MSSRKRIVIDLTPILPGGDNGGAKGWIITLIQHLSKAAPDLRLILLTHARSHHELAVLDAVNVRRSMMSGRPWHRLKRRWLFSHVSYQLLFCPFTDPVYHRAHIPTVCTVYDLQYKTYPTFFEPAECAHRDRVMREACQHASRIVSISEYTKQRILAHFKVAPTRLQTIYLQLAKGFEPQAAPPTILTQLGLHANNYLFYPANFWKHKNHSHLFTAFDQARQRGLAQEIKLICTGAAVERYHALKEQVEALGLASHVLFPGYVERQALAQLLLHARGLIFPSLYEGFGIPVIEAFANQIPVACSDCTALPEIAGDGAILFNPHEPAAIAEAMLRLVDVKVREPWRIQQGQQRALAFSSAAAMACDYLDVFRACMRA